MLRKDKIQKVHTRYNLFISDNFWSSFASLVQLERECSVFILSSSVQVLGQGHGTLVERVSELHPHPQLDQVRNLGQQFYDCILQS